MDTDELVLTKIVFVFFAVVGVLELLLLFCVTLLLLVFDSLFFNNYLCDNERTE